MRPLHALVTWLAVSLALAPTAARALDCTKAETATDKAICGNEALKAQDAALARLYFDTLRGLTGERHALLIDDQRRWLADERDSACEKASLVPCLVKSLSARRRAIAICFAGAKDGAQELGGTPINGADLCTLALHRTCPKTTTIASARLAAYPWLLQKILNDASRDDGGGDCAPESGDDPGTPDQNESTSTTTILAERPGVVSIRTENDSMSRGAAHPAHDEDITTFDTQTKTAIPIGAVLPALKAGTPVLAKISEAANKVLDPSCCDGGDDHTFQGIGLQSNEPIPDGWAVASDGDLILAYSYNAYGRDFVATAKIPRALIIEAVDPKYAGVFVKEPGAK